MISCRPYFTSDLTLLPFFNILIALTLISLCSPTRYAHTNAMQTIAVRRAIRSMLRRCVSSVCHSKHEDIDVDLTEFPVGAVKAQNQSCLDWQKRKYHFGDNVNVESISGKKSLQAAQVGISFNTRRHRLRYLV